MLNCGRKFLKPFPKWLNTQNNNFFLMESIKNIPCDFKEKPQSSALLLVGPLQHREPKAKCSNLT